MQIKLLFILFSLFFKVLGTPEPQTAIILLQNNHELRATGGFMGSYANLELKGSSSDSGQSEAEDSSDVEPHLSLTFQDIYVPDGQIQGHVEPPAPIQKAFGQGWFKLRDANWDPNFPTSATAIRWFLEKGGEINPDVLLAINLSTIEKILKITGPIAVEPQNLTIDANNISLLLQNEIQQNFFPGSTNKKDLITASSKAFIQKLSSLNLKQKITMVRTIGQDLINQEILINSTNPKLQAYLEKKDFAGQLKPVTCKNCLSDTVAIIESNLGSNKANSFVTRHTTHTITKGQTLEGDPLDNSGAGPLGQRAEGGSVLNGPNSITHQITINFQNTSPSENTNPPNHHGGDYINYLRLYIPTAAINVQIKQGATLQSAAGSHPEVPKITPNHGFQEIGFFHTTPHQQSSSVTISYKLPTTNLKTYQLSILKQPGIGNSSQTINLPNKTLETTLNQDFITSFKL
jgi:hypothetical protein